jgi:hypothetical protein
MLDHMSTDSGVLHWQGMAKKEYITVSKAPETTWMKRRSKKFLLPIGNGNLELKPAIIKLRYSWSLK